RRRVGMQLLHHHLVPGEVIEDCRWPAEQEQHDKDPERVLPLVLDRTRRDYRGKPCHGKGYGPSRYKPASRVETVVIGTPHTLTPPPRWEFLVSHHLPARFGRTLRLAVGRRTLHLCARRT